MKLLLVSLICAVYFTHEYASASPPVFRSVEENPANTAMSTKVPTTSHLELKDEEPKAKMPEIPDRKDKSLARLHQDVIFRRSPFTYCPPWGPCMEMERR